MEGRGRPLAEPAVNESALSQPSPLTAPVAAGSAGSATKDGGAGNTAAALEVMEIMQRIVALAPQLTFEELLKVNKIFSDLLHLRAQAGTGKQESGDANSPMRPQHLDYSPPGPPAGSGESEPAQDGAESDAGSVGSVCRPSSDDGDARSTSASSDASEPAQWVPGGGVSEQVAVALAAEEPTAVASAAEEPRSPRRSGRRKGRRTGHTVGSPQAGSPEEHAGPPGGRPDSAQANRSERRKHKAAQRRPAAHVRGNILVGRNVCPRGHNLELPVDLSSVMKCDVCDGTIASAAPRYACVECDYDVCHTCAMGQR